MRKLDSLTSWPSKERTRKIFWVSLVLAIIFNVVTANKLIQSNYPESGMVGPYPSWWFTFDEVELKSHYAVLEEQGTLDTFVLVQYLDFGLMLSTGVLLFIVAVIVARLFNENKKLRHIGFISAILIAASPVMDFFENIVLLAMLSNHLSFPGWMAIAYSGFATAKVTLVSVGLIVVISFAMLRGVRRVFSKNIVR